RFRAAGMDRHCFAGECLPIVPGELLLWCSAARFLEHVHHGRAAQGCTVAVQDRRSGQEGTFRQVNLEMNALKDLRTISSVLGILSLVTNAVIQFFFGDPQWNFIFLILSISALALACWFVFRRDRAPNAPYPKVFVYGRLARCGVVVLLLVALGATAYTYYRRPSPFALA